MPDCKWMVSRIQYPGLHSCITTANTITNYSTVVVIVADILDSSLDDVIHRGQTCRVTNIVSKYIHDCGYDLNTPRRKRSREEENKVTDGFQGAHCFEPIVGVHTDFILGLDFPSLYPSAIRRYNIDPSTLVLSPTTISTTKRSPTDGKDDYAEFVINTKQAPIPLLLAIR